MPDLRRVTVVLDVIAKGRGSLTVTDLATRTGLSRSSVHRILQALEREQYVMRVPAHTSYTLGPGLLNFGIDAHLRLVAANRGHLVTLSRALSENTELAVIVGSSVVVIDGVSGSDRLGGTASVGKRFPLHATSFGKALLSRLPDQNQRSIIAETLPRFTPNTVTDRDALLHQLETIGRINVAIDVEEHRTGICTLATAINAPIGGLQAIGVVIPTHRIRQKLGVAIEALHRFNPQIDVAAAKPALAADVTSIWARAE